MKAAVDPLIARGLPANIEAEKAVLGAILLDNAAYTAAAPLISPGDFFADANRRIFRQMVKLSESARPIDFTTLAEELIQDSELEAVGGAVYLSSLTDGLPRSANIEHYARIVADKATARRLIHTVASIYHQALEGGADIAALLDRAEAAILAVGQDRIRAGLASMSEIFSAAYQSLDELVSGGARRTGLATGFRALDDLTCGLQPAELILLAARPSMGKTALALDIARSVAQRSAVAFFSLEMTNEALFTRAVCAEARVNSHRMRTGFLRAEDPHRIAGAAGRLTESHLYIDDTAGISLYELRAKARRLKAERGLALVIVDYIQLMSMPRGENRNNEIDALARGMKGLAKELGVPVLALSQLSRAPETRGGDHRPQLSDLRDSGGLEQTADVVMFLYREDYYLRMMGREVPVDAAGRADVVVAKQRNGPVGKVNLAFLDSYSSFADLAEEK